jgi:hypothetical protein
MARSCYRARAATRSRSCEAATVAWMVAMTATNGESVACAMEDTTMSVLVGAASAGKPDGEPWHRC